MKVLVTMPEHVREELFTADEWRRLESLGEVRCLADDERRLPIGVCSDVDVMVTGWESPKLESVDGDRLRLIVHSAGGFKTVICEQVFDAGVTVSQAGSDPMAHAVAEFALGLGICLLREIYTYDRAMRATRDFDASQCPRLSRGITAARQGLVGLSRTGKWHARLLRGVGCSDVVAYDPYCSESEASGLGVTLGSLDEVMGCELVSLHAPVTPETLRMIGARELALIPDGGALVNTARAAIVDMDALERELRSGRIRAAIDVFDEEPLDPSSPLFGLPNALLTPHVAGGTVQARWAMGRAVVDEIERFALGSPLQFLVQPATVNRLS
uniref:hydroxyacid dehydrogenase n=1 Tax=Tessaracoccus timonensis TaxID=2161816 RepID=UPI000D561CC8|nr:hydroxyacid dehydrogenase [Tessaracoccus timonensis]